MTKSAMGYENITRRAARRHGAVYLCFLFLIRITDNFSRQYNMDCTEWQRRGCDIGRTTYPQHEANEPDIRASMLIERKRYSL